MIAAVVEVVTCSSKLQLEYTCIEKETIVVGWRLGI